MISANSERQAQLRAFDETKLGVKGLVDAGVSIIPSIFIHPPNDSALAKTCSASISVPIIDLSGIKVDQTRRKEAVDRLRDALETWGFFQVVNHGIPETILEGMIRGVKSFFEQDDEVKKGYYTRDYSEKLITNDKYKSVEHRVLAKSKGPRISVASFFTTSYQPYTRVFGPIKELLSDSHPPRFRETTVKDYATNYRNKGLDGTSALDSLRLYQLSYSK